MTNVGALTWGFVLGASAGAGVAIIAILLWLRGKFKRRFRVVVADIHGNVDNGCSVVFNDGRFVEIQAMAQEIIGPAETDRLLLDVQEEDWS